jgi:hypothetical protein
MLCTGSLRLDRIGLASTVMPPSPHLARCCAAQPGRRRPCHPRPLAPPPARTAIAGHTHTRTHTHTRAHAQMHTHVFLWRFKAAGLSQGNAPPNRKRRAHAAVHVPSQSGRSTTARGDGTRGHDTCVYVCVYVCCMARTRTCSRIASSALSTVAMSGRCTGSSCLGGRACACQTHAIHTHAHAPYTHAAAPNLPHTPTHLTSRPR